jgi:hypothetical protein
MNTKEIAANVKNISLESSATAGVNKLCEIWPVAKEALELLAAAVKNPALKVIIGVIIAAGDAITGKICK